MGADGADDNPSQIGDLSDCLAPLGFLITATPPPFPRCWCIAGSEGVLLNPALKKPGWGAR